MTDGGSPPDINRRRVLAGLGSLGAVGALGGIGLGAGTRSFLDDAEIFQHNTLRNGALDLVVDWETDTDHGTVTDGQVSIPVDPLTADNSTETVTITLSLPQPPTEDPTGQNNPAYVWLRVPCPRPVESMLAAHLTVTLSPVDCATDTVGAPIATWTANEVPDTLRTGVPLTTHGVGVPGKQACLTTAEEWCLQVAWTLDDTYGGSETLTLDFDVVAQQCRYGDPETNPFAGVEGAPCLGLPACDCCVRVGKLEFDDDNSAPGTYDFTEGTTDYAVRILPDSVTKEGDELVAVALELVPRGDTPLTDICRVEVAASRGLATYERPQLGAPDHRTPLLYAPPRTEEPTDPGDYYGISHITVSTCESMVGGTCPADLVTEPRLESGNDGDGLSNSISTERLATGIDSLPAGIESIPTSTGDGGIR